MASGGHGSLLASPSQASGWQQAAPPQGVRFQCLLLPDPQSDTSATPSTCLCSCMCAHACGTHNYMSTRACMHTCVQHSPGSCAAAYMAGRSPRVAHMCAVLVCFRVCTNVLGCC